MKHAYLLTFFILFVSPLFAHADFVVPPSQGTTFENQQNLTFSAHITEPNTLIPEQGAVSPLLHSPVSIAYHIDHIPTWPSRNASPETQDTLFAQTIKENQMYLELWEGVPFTSAAHMIQNWDITNAPDGTVSLTFPENGSYFLIAYLPDAFYQDPQAECPNNPNWQTDCAPSYTLDQMRGYFSTPLDTLVDPFPYLPDAYGGTMFTVGAVDEPKQSSNVLFLPGIEGSRLYTRNNLGVEESVWEPSIITSISNLALNSDGSSQHIIYTRDLVDYLYGIRSLGDVYGPFKDFMNDLVSKGTITAWKAFPYDWRYDVQDIVTNGTLTGNSTGSLTRTYLQDTIQALASTSPTEKVTIVAHSNGGLLAKALAIELQKEGKIHLLDKIILIGSPQFGTPTSIGALLNGDGQTDGIGGLIMYGGTVRTVSATMPGMFGLLPTAAYFTHDLDAPVLFAINTLNNLYEKYFGPALHSVQSLESFVTNAGGINNNFPASDLHTPLTLSDTIFQKESATHALLDSWVPPADVTVTAISGWGKLTPFQYTYSSSDKKYLTCFRVGLLGTNCTYSYQVHHAVTNTESGDNTVVSSTATGDTAQQYYFNAKTFSADKLGEIGHGDLTSAAPIQILIKNLLANTDSAIPYISKTIPDGGLRPLSVVSVHSPVNIIVNDSSGNQTGIFPVPGHPDIFYKKELIPGSSVQILDDEKYVYLPEDQSYTISLQGYDAGATTLDIGTINSSGVATTTLEFPDIPTTASTTANFSITVPSDANLAPMLPTEIPVDIFGDGSTTLIESGTNTATTSRLKISDKNTVSKKKILLILAKASTLFSLGDELKKRFLSEVSKIENFSSTLDAKGNITLLEKLVQSQIGIKLTNFQGIFFLKFLDTLQNQL